MERLSGLDAAFLYLETATNHMSVGALAVLDPSTVPGGYAFQKVRDVLESRAHLVPPLRRRLVEVPLGLHHPVWVDDPDFRLDAHLRRAALPAPGGEQELAELVAEVMSHPLDRRRPLWELHVVEGLESGMLAVLFKTHHAAVDGVAAAQLALALLDLQPQPSPVPPREQPWAADPLPTGPELVADALSALAGQPRAAVEVAGRAVQAALRVRQRNREAGVTPPPGPFTAPRTSLSTSVSPWRRFASAQLPLEEVRRVKRAVGGTVNDVVLAVCSGALRSYLADRGEQVHGDLVALVPISVPGEDRAEAGGNRISPMLVSLATTVEDPVRRLQAIHESTERAKEQDKEVAAGSLTSWVDVVPPALAVPAARLASSLRVVERLPPVFNVVVSNVPGPDLPLYLAGARLAAVYPLGPVVDGAALNVTVLSYGGQMSFGLLADAKALPEVGAIASRLEPSFEELRKAVDGPAGA